MFTFRTYYIGQQLLAVAIEHTGFRTNGGRLAWVPSVAHFCPECGSIWAREVVDEQPWTVRIAACPKHGAGTLIEDDNIERACDPYYREYYPRELLQYEFLRRSA